MASAPEQRLTQQVIRYLKQLRVQGERIWWVKLHGGPQQQRGLPDLLVIYDGRHTFIELKAPGGRLTKFQAYAIREINAVRGRAVVCRSLNEVRRVLVHELTGPDRRKPTGV